MTKIKVFDKVFNTVLKTVKSQKSSKISKFRHNTKYERSKINFRYYKWYFPGVLNIFNRVFNILTEKFDF